MRDDLLQALDDTIHVKARLAIMTILLMEGSATFTRLKQGLGLSDGNLGAHVHALEDAGYITVHKEFVRRRPRSTCAATEIGRKAFRAYVDTLERVFDAARRGLDGDDPEER